MIVYFIKQSEAWHDKKQRYDIYSADKLPYTQVGPNTFVVEPAPELTFIAFTETEELARKIVSMLVDEACACVPDMRNGCTWDAISEFELK